MSDITEVPVEVPVAGGDPELESEPSPLERAIEAAGGLRECAAKLGVRYQALQNWRKEGVPPKRVIPLERISGVSRTELRPDLYPEEELSTTSRKVG